MIISESHRRSEVNSNFERDFNDYFPKALKETKDQINADLFQFEQFDNEEIVNLINLITAEEEYKEKIFQEVKNILFEYAKNNRSVSHLNAIVVGPTGV